jgi:sarcosine oxidase subunit alpha
MGTMVSKTKDSIGAVLSAREGMTAPDGLSLVGFRPVNPADSFAAGCHLMAKDGAVNAATDQGYVTSLCYSPHLGHVIGLGLIKNGAARHGEVMRAVNPVQNTETLVEVVSPHFIDPKGERLRA